MNKWSPEIEKKLTALIKDWLKQHGRTQADLKNSLQADSSRMPAILDILKRAYLRGGLPKIAGIFITHAHIGHYSGLMYLGKEALGANKVNVYAMQRMSNFLKSNGPWSQLINDQNILINKMTENQNIILNKNISVLPIKVPHRDEFSETVGFYIKGINKTALFLPDIDKWNKWQIDIVDIVENSTRK